MGRARKPTPSELAIMKAGGMIDLSLVYVDERGGLSPLQRVASFRSEEEHKRNGEKSAQSRRRRHVKITLAPVRGMP